jgi:fructose-1,6-bisphosphatase/inositol monophosphatase family enzyme
MRKGVHSVRTLGSGVLDLCYVACGRLDFIYAGVGGEGWKPWDYVAGSLYICIHVHKYTHLYIHIYTHICI